MAISFEMHQKFDLLDKLLSYHDEMFLIVMKEQLGVVDMNYKFIFHPQENTETFKKILLSIYEAINKLDHTDRFILIQRYIMGFEVDYTVSELGITEAEYKAMYKQALQNFLLYYGNDALKQLVLVLE